MELVSAVVYHPQGLGIDGLALLQHLNGGLHHPVLQLHRLCRSVLNIGGQVAEILGAVPGADLVNGAGNGLGKAVVGKQRLIGRLCQVGSEIVLRIRPAVGAGARRPDLEPEVHPQGHVGAQVVLGDGAAVGIHPVFPECRRGLKGVGEIDHGDVAISVGTLLEHGAAGGRGSVLVGLGLRHPVLPGHAVGGIAFQAGDGVGPGIAILHPLDVIGLHRHRLPIDLVVLVGLGGGHPLQGEG